MTTPLRLQVWEVELRRHPDSKYTQFLLDGIRRGFRIGFRIGFDYSSHSCTSSAKNMKSAYDHPDPIDSYIMGELAMGRIIGPIVAEFRDRIQVSRFGVIPKLQVAFDYGLIVPGREQRQRRGR